MRAAGLAPQAKTEVTLVTPQGAESLFLGAGTGSEVYARLGPQGQVVKVGKDPAGADRPGGIHPGRPPPVDRRRRRSGQGGLGDPGQNLDRNERTESWKITGPDQAEASNPSRGSRWASLLPEPGVLQPAAPGRRGGERILPVEFLGRVTSPSSAWRNSGRRARPR